MLSLWYIKNTLFTLVYNRLQSFAFLHVDIQKNTFSKLVVWDNDMSRKGSWKRLKSNVEHPKQKERKKKRKEKKKKRKKKRRTGV